MKESACADLRGGSLELVGTLCEHAFKKACQLGTEQRCPELKATRTHWEKTIAECQAA